MYSLSMTTKFQRAASYDEMAGSKDSITSYVKISYNEEVGNAIGRKKEAFQIFLQNWVGRIQSGQ